MANPNPLPVRSQGRDEQALRRASRTYGAIERDPDNPVEGYTWIRRDLSPPQLRVNIEGTIYKLEFTAA